MKGNLNSRWAPHMIEHTWNAGCDADPPCEPVVLTQADFDATKRAAGEPYPLRAGDFDPERHEAQANHEHDGQRVWSSTHPPEWADDPNYLIVVRNKLKPRTLEEVIEVVLPVAAYGRLTLTTVIDALREAFPELRDK